MVSSKGSRMRWQWIASAKPRRGWGGQSVCAGSEPETTQDDPEWQVTRLRTKPCRWKPGQLPATSSFEVGSLDCAFDCRQTGSYPETYYIQQFECGTGVDSRPQIRKGKFP